MVGLRTCWKGLGWGLLIALGACGGSGTAGGEPGGERPGGGVANPTDERPAVADGPQATETNATGLSELEEEPSDGAPGEMAPQAPDAGSAGSRTGLETGLPVSASARKD